MKISYNWLKDFIEIKEPPEELADILTNLGFETTFSKTHYDFNDIVIAKVLKKEKHPNADKLSLCEVIDGKNNYSVVCGAPNVEVGQKVPFAKIGSKVGGVEIKKMKFREVYSDGMLCSQKELGITESSDGIMILGEDADIGKDLSSLYGEDYIFEVETLPNRPDILSHLGIAQELSAKLTRAVNAPEFASFEIPPDETLADVSSGEICSRYIGVLLDDIKIKPSSERIKSRLISCDIRPINNIVDITNYCMLALGHPLHAFDYEKLSGGKLRIRKALKGEKLKALDGKDYILETSDIVIADEKKPVAIAGIIGGENVEVCGETKKIILESAVFDPKSVFNTRKRLNISTDASYRFERGMFFNRAEMACRMALAIIEKAGLGKALLKSDRGEAPAGRKIVLFYEKIKKRTGIDISDVRVEKILSGLSFKIENKKKEFVTLGVPYFREDISVPEDVIEEIVRIYGYDNVESKPAFHAIKTESSAGCERFCAINKIKDLLNHLGFSEAANYGLVAEKWAEYFDRAKCFSVANPVSPDMVILRPSLFCELWENFVSNYNNGSSDQMIFEIGEVFYDGVEHLSLGILSSGNIFGENWRKTGVEAGFFHLKDIVQKIYDISELTIDYSTVVPSRKYMKSDFNIISGDKSLGYIGAVSEMIACNSGTQKPVWWAEIKLEPIFSNPKKTERFNPYSVFPSSVRDVCLLVPKNLGWKFFANSVREILEKDEKILDEIKLLDVFEGGDHSKIPRDTVSMTIRIVLRHPSKTLMGEELKSIYDKLFDELATRFSVRLREI